ncbi:DUF5666 domain-containing protein [Idiomarina sp. HP20-50]|uniref:DUF5666 domain-containing protein n=1 Tax=Idiomarina sp. HP20-50 TaxID=3070813 RepID=UPI00294B2AC9|nr:DUF5666 domain-containing protein [Idiomarina sp. HP20-50]MDV6316131.1 DUF5666 domain-containing protein [Idiomarina sp. HP20-50]
MRFKHSLLVAAIAGTLSACGGSSESSTDTSSGNTSDNNTATTTTVVTEGVITGFGSVYVNGQRYRSENATIAVGNSPAAEEAQLKVGMVVRVAASASSNGEDPEAEQITYEESLQGPVSFIDTAAEQIEVLGQTVIYDDLTEFEGTDIDTLTVGEFVEISGYINENGEFYATLVELETDETEIKLTGNIANLDADATTFTLGGLTINYSEAQFEDMVAADLANELFVKVEGETYDSETLTLTATTIENKEDTELAEDTDEVTIAGIVKNYDADAGTFTVNRYDFVLGDNTEFEDGTVDTLANGIIVKVEAALDGDQLVAGEVEFKAKKARSKVEGSVTDLNTEAMTFVLNGTTYAVTPETQYEDESDLEERQFTFDNIAVNNWLKVFSRQDDEGNAIALKVKRINEEAREGEVKGRATDVTTEGMTVANVAVTFDSDTEFKNEDGNLAIERLVELAGTQNAVIVEVEGSYVDNSLVATEVEVEAISGDGDDDRPDKTGRAEFKGDIESIEGDLVFVNGKELRLTGSTEFKLNDEEVDLQTFYNALEVGTVIEIEGIWVDQTYIDVKEAEIETEEDE